MKLEERLNEIIEQKDDEIVELERKVELLENQLDYANHVWQHHFSFQENDFYGQMPYPRLEMRLRRLSKGDWYNIEWIYGLVYKHTVDTFSENKTLLFIPLGRTTSSGGTGELSYRIREGNKIDMPHRDSLHIYIESLMLKIPAYIVCEEMNLINKIGDQWGGTHTQETLKKVLKNEPNNTD